MKKYLCVKDYRPVITKTNGKKEPTDESVVKRGDVMTQMGNNDSRFASRDDSDLALYEYTILEYKDCFRLIP